MLGTAASFDLWQYFVDDDIVRECLSEERIQAVQQIGDRFIVAAHEGNSHFLSHCGQSGAPDGRYLQAWRRPLRELS